MLTALRPFLPLLLVLPIVSPGQAAILTVWPDGHGTYRTIQMAVDLAPPGSEIVLQPGTFKGAGNRDIDFKGKAIIVRSSNPNNSAVVAATIVDCEGVQGFPGGGGGVYRRGFSFLTNEGSASVLAGITIINASLPRDYEPGWSGSNEGSAIRCVDSSPTIRNCVIRDCYGQHGSGLFSSGGSPRLEGCTFRNCRGADHMGTALIITGADQVVITDCTFDGCGDSGLSVGANDCRISGCEFTGCASPLGANAANLVLSWCTFSVNSGFDGMSAIWLGGDTLTMTNCIVDETRLGPWFWTGDYGASAIECGARLATFRNCQVTNTVFNDFDGNAGYGGAVAVGSATATFIGCTIAGSNPHGGGGIYVDLSKTSLVLRNTIVWGHTPGPFSGTPTAAIDATYCDIQGGLAGVGNIDADPLFSADYHLREGSPCLNGGDPAYVPVEGEMDIDAQARVLYGRVDIGADERPLDADFNGDGTVDVVDLLIFIDAWASQAGDPNYDPGADFNDDGAVDVIDLMIMAEYFRIVIPPQP